MKKAIFYPFILLFFLSCSKGEGPVNPIPPNPDPGSSVNAEVDQSVQAFMTKYAAPGLSVAITRNGKLVFAKGYGFADRETGDKVSVSSLFRISSISKSVTSAAIMKLMEQGKLTLNQKVFGEGALLGKKYGTQPYGQYIQDITVKQLLQHAAGGWTNQSDDPTMADQSMTSPELLSWILNNKPLSFAPGTTYIYSNAGFFILGRIIEEVSGQSYEQYVQDNLLKPSGITAMAIGGSTLADRKVNEVKNYGQGNDNPYKYNFPRRDANGGWIASSTDMMRLMMSIDGMSTVPDLLSSASVQTMVTPSATNSSYACGWTVNTSGTWSHSGSFPGSASYWTRTQSGYAGIILVNSNSPASAFSGDFQKLLQEIIGKGSRFPDVNLF